MTPEDAVPVLARMVTELRAEVASLHRERQWHLETISRNRWTISRLKRANTLADSRLHRFWMERFTPAQVNRLARELDKVA